VSNAHLTRGSAGRRAWALACLLAATTLAACSPADSEDVGGDADADAAAETSQPDAVAEVSTPDVPDADASSGPDSQAADLPGDTAPDAALDADTEPDTAPDTEPDADADAEPDAEPDAAQPPTLRGPCALAQRAGAFLVESAKFGSVSGSVASGVVPVTILETVQQQGDCLLLKRNNPFCAPPCQPGSTCDFDGTCIPFPPTQDLGTVTVTGLVDGDIAMSPAAPGNNYFDTTVPNPPFGDSALITLTTSSDGAFGQQTLYGRGFGVLDANLAWSVDSAAPFQLTWTPPTAPHPEVTVHLELNVDQHGNSPLFLVCDFADDGAATVPGDLIAALLTAGVTGFPNGVIRRQTIDSVPIGTDLCMELLVSSKQIPAVSVDGHTPCKKPSDCPAGQVCNLPINTCQ
jgi:hypothetical protein